MLFHSGIHSYFGYTLFILVNTFGDTYFRRVGERAAYCVRVWLTGRTLIRMRSRRMSAHARLAYRAIVTWAVAA